jgi:DNA-binding CsgD family transcriptional regulator
LFLQRWRKRLDTLSVREREVLVCIARGRGPTETALLLGIDTKTVQTYRARLMAKLRARTNRDLIVIAYRVGLC